MLRWLRERRRRKLMQTPFPTWWEAILKRNVAHYTRLPAPLQNELKKITQVLVAEKRWEGCGGFVVTEEVKVTIAAQAAIPILACRHDYFHRVKTIIIYPTAFRSPNPEDDYEDDEISDDIMAGQAYYRGPVILSWDTVLQEGRDPDGGHNVIIHEFAHQIDYLNYQVDGFPPIEDPVLAARWQKVMSLAFEEHQQLLKAGQHTFFSEQAGDEPTEFFADACEAFFCLPSDLADAYPDVYAVMQQYFCLNPKAWPETKK